MGLPFENITQIPNSDPAPDAEPSLWNTRYDEIDDNFAYVQGEIEVMQEDISDIETRLGIIEVEGPLAITKAVKSDWHYRTNKTAMEFWTPYWTLIDGAPINITTAVSGDDSVDVDSTEGLVEGADYVIQDSLVREVITVSKILTATRFLAVAALSNSFQAGSVMSRTSFSVNQAESKAAVSAGDVYLCGPIILGDAAMKSCIIRRNESALLSVFFKDSAHTEWTEVGVAWQRQPEADGIYEDEYLFPADGGEIQMKVEGNTGMPDGGEVYGIIFLV